MNMRGARRLATFLARMNQRLSCAMDSHIGRKRQSRNRRGRIRGAETQHVLGNPILLLISEVRVHRQRENLGSNCFTNWEIPPAVAEMCVCLLKVERDGVVDSRTNARLSEMLLKRIAILNANYVKMVDCLCPGRLVGEAKFLFR